MGISVSSMCAGQVWLQSDGCFTVERWTCWVWNGFGVGIKIGDNLCVTDHHGLHA